MVTTPPRLTGAAEQMDQPDLDPAERLRALQHLARVNSLFGGTRVVLDLLPRLCDGLPTPIRLLDVGTGYADIPRAIVRWARRRGQPMEIEAVDRDPATVALAARACAAYPEIRLRHGDALALPFDSRSFDLVLASQILHHLEGTEPVRLLRELARVARYRILINDLRRGAWPLAVTWAALHLVSRSPVIRHDGPLSIRRGYVATELEALAEAAGWTAPRVLRRAFFRLALLEHGR
jgi:2-polyprenyl-3-methyl-5-hydroxy-6-metoxy-1,4-benzoquinol methylase